MKTLAPLSAPSVERVDRILAAQRALLAPVVVGDTLREDDWASAVTGAVRTVSGCDHTLFVVPAVGGAASADPARKVRVYSDDTDPTVPAAFEAAFARSWGADPTARDDLLRTAHHARRRGGAGVYHERDLTPRAAVERSPFFREVLDPFGLRHVLGIAVPLPDGREFSVAAFYESQHAPGFSDDTLADLALLVPAFDAGVRSYLRHGPEALSRRATLVTTVDALKAAVLVTDTQGAEVHRSAALDRLIGAEGDDGRLLALVQRWARHLADHRPRAVAPEAYLRGVRGSYGVRGLRLDESPDVGGLVVVEPAGLPLPDSRALRDRFGLTKREAEVALLLATGLADRVIAAQLYIAHATARRHTERVLRKLGVKSRAAVASCLCTSRPGARASATQRA